MCANKIRDENYYQVQGWMINRLGLKGVNLETYAIIYGFTQDGENKFTGSIQYLCDFTNTSRPTVIKALKTLVDCGYITKQEKIVDGIKCNEYMANLEVVKNLYWGSKEFLLGGSKETLLGGSKESLPNNKGLDNKGLDNKKDIDITSEFKRLWELYPNKKGKTDALKAFERAVKNGTPISDIEAGIIAYNAEIEAKKTAKQYIKHGSTWFNQQAWNDEYETAGGNMNGKYSGSGEVTAQPERTLGTFV